MTAAIDPTYCPTCAERAPVGLLSADELHAELVADGVAYHATELRRFVLAVRRIAKLRRIDVEAATKAVVDEVESLTGRGMPMV